jgi:hypothetical protein
MLQLAAQASCRGQPLSSNVERPLPGVEIGKSKDRNRCKAASHQ